MLCNVSRPYMYIAVHDVIHPQLRLEGLCTRLSEGGGGGGGGGGQQSKLIHFQKRMC